MATDPDVRGAQRLFSAWLEAQIAYRQLPGVVVGVVADQDLVWAKGFGYADVQAERPMAPDTKFRMGMDRSPSSSFSTTRRDSHVRQVRTGRPSSKRRAVGGLCAAAHLRTAWHDRVQRRHRIGGKTYVGHGGGYPGYTTQTLIQLDSRVGVIVLTNTNDSNPMDIARQLTNTVGEAVAKASAQKPKPIAWDPSWARFAGLYRGVFGDNQVVLLNQRLVLITPNAANVDNPITLEPLGEGRFHNVAPAGGGPVGEVVRFVEENGRVVRMFTGDSYADRVSDR